MRYPELRKLKHKAYFSIEELPGILKIRPESARVLCSRYAQSGLFVRLKKGIYVLGERWEGLSREEFLKIANLLQVPSYISFQTALSYYGLSTQVQQNFFESTSLKRSLKADIKGAAFRYYKLKKPYYFDFTKRDGVFIASPEKAFLDAVYLGSFGKYKLDMNAVDIDKLDRKKLKNMLKGYPEQTKKIIKKLCRI